MGGKVGSDKGISSFPSVQFPNPSNPAASDRPPHRAPPATLVAECKMPSQIKSDLKSESAQDAEHPVVRGSKKSDTSRANGAKSRGPVTPEGRAKSSRHSTRHGLRAKSIVLPPEPADEFH